MKKALTLASLSLAFIPALAYAQSNTGILGLLDQVNLILSKLLPLIITLTLIVFLWGIFKFVMSGGDTEQRREARGYIIWGIIALFVMVSVWGLVNILSRTVNLDPTPPQPPTPVQAGVKTQ